MKTEIYQLGRHLIRLLPNEYQPQDIRSAAVRTGNRPSAFFSKISSGYLLIMDEAYDVTCDDVSLGRLLQIAGDTGAGLVYSDFLQKDGDIYTPHPLNDYSEGSIRDDFNFGPLFIFSAPSVQAALRKYGPLPNDPSLALYDLRLKVSVDFPVLHIPEFLYSASARKPKAVRRSGVKTEAHFAYVARENALRQKKLEKIATRHLELIGAHLPPRLQTAGPIPEDFQWKASIVIPVFNRKKTIADALRSALTQQTDFAFNILVVDNHSTDGTTEILKKFAATYPHIQHILPVRRDLGIGGCWNEAVFSPACGRYAVQLDSDDLYSSPHTLQKIVDALRKGPYAMVVGSYTLVNEKLQPIPPGLIDHREWTRTNGHNNLLRINGMGAPRAFDTAILRLIGFPNVSYGEDYAVALRLTREYKIGRIFDSLYLCRRWSDNTDAALSIEKQNRNDHYKDRLRTIEIKARQEMNRGERSRPFTEESNQIFAEFPGSGHNDLASLCRNFFKSQKQTWPALADACRSLKEVKTRQLSCGRYAVTLQYNPSRIVSGSAPVDPDSIRKRPCFLCNQNRPADQHAVRYRGEYLLLCNPAPIFDQHFTIVSTSHTPQNIESSIGAFLQVARDASSDYTVFYNGPACGASAPDHLHFQMIPDASLPFLSEPKKPRALTADPSVRIAAAKGYDRAIVVMESRDMETLKDNFLSLMNRIRTKIGISDEPPVNVFCTYEKSGWRLTVFLRGKHRPDAYYAEGNDRLMISPGAIDMAGVIIFPLFKDFERISCRMVRDIYREISLEEKTLNTILETWSISDV